MGLTRSGGWWRRTATWLPGWVVLAALALGGCDPQRLAALERGVSTEVEAREQFGDPVTVTVPPDGTRVLDPPREVANCGR